MGGDALLRLMHLTVFGVYGVLGEGWAFLGGCFWVGWMEYRRIWLLGGCYAFTVVTFRRSPWLCQDVARAALREAIVHVRKRYPFTIEAMVLLPDHLHCVWTMPEGDSDYATRWRLIKTYVTRKCVDRLELPVKISKSRYKRGERNLWHRRYWEHCIRDDRDFTNQCNYIHNNPVKHGYCAMPKDWEYSSFHRFVSEGKYPKNW